MNNHFATTRYFRLAGLISFTLLTIALASEARTAFEEVPDPNPKLQQKTFKLAEGLEINLFASDPALAKPTNINWDASGRLWVSTAQIYPQIKPGQEANDKVIVFEDKDRDGVAEKSTVFADHLLIPLSVLPGDGGAYVTNSDELIHLQDTDGDGKADKEEVILSGFGTNDTHHMFHTLTWGPDGFMYFNQSIYTFSHIETPWGIKRLGEGGMWKFNPKNLKLSVFMEGMVNPWGLKFDTWGQSFATDGAGYYGIYHVFPNVSLIAFKNSDLLMHGLNPGQPKFCSIEMISGRHFPKEYQGLLVANDFRGHRTALFKVVDDGAGFFSDRIHDLITSNHAAFRPVDVKMGPDGALYIADFYDPIINHGEVDWRDERRDHVHGRIWRVTAKGAPLIPNPKLNNARVSHLLNALKKPEQWTRHFAKRELSKKSKRIVGRELKVWLKQLDKEDPLYDRHRLEALWTFQQIDIVNKKLLYSLLDSTDHRVRSATIRVLHDWAEHFPNILDILAIAVTDENPRVRREVISGLRNAQSPQAAAIALHAIDKETDKFIDHALLKTVRALEPFWLNSLKAGKDPFNGNAKHLLYALKTSDKREAIQQLSILLKEEKIPNADFAETVELIAAKGTADELDVIFHLARNNTTPTDKKAIVLNSLINAARQTGNTPHYRNLLLSILNDSKQANLFSATARLAGHWKIHAARKKLQQRALDNKTKESDYLATLDGLQLLGSKEAIQSIEQIIKNVKNPTRKIHALTALAQTDLNQAKKHIKSLNHMPEGTDVAPFFNAFINAKNGSKTLAKALERITISKYVAERGIQAARATGRPLDHLVEAFRKAGDLKLLSQSFTPEQLAAIIGKVKNDGDPVRGEEIYRRDALACISCHAIAGAGGLVGPDIVSLGASAPIDYIIESLIEPSKKIKEGYHLTIVTTKDNQVHTGMVAEKTASKLTLRNAANQLIEIPTAQVTEESIIPTSLMPPALTASLQESEFVDLVRFLAELGKDGPYKVGPERLVRKWQYLTNADKGSRIIRDKGIGSVFTDPELDWKNIFSYTDGSLPIKTLPSAKWANNLSTFMKFEVEVTTPGVVGFKIEDTSGLTFWVGDKNVLVKELTTVQLDKGRHTIAIGIERTIRNSPLRIEAVRLQNSKASMNILNEL